MVDMQSTWMLECLVEEVPTVVLVEKVGRWPNWQEWLVEESSKV